jgi:hypothetical protein
MSKKVIPDKEAQWIDASGRPTQAFLEYIQDLDKRAFREKVSLTSASTLNNGFPMRYVSSTGLWTPSTF